MHIADELLWAFPAHQQGVRENRIVVQNESKRGLPDEPIVQLRARDVVVENGFACRAKAAPNVYLPELKSSLEEGRIVEFDAAVRRARDGAKPDAGL